MKIAILIKNKRLELNESQTEFARRFGLSYAAISDLETGKTQSITEDMLNFIFNITPCPGYCTVCFKHCQHEDVRQQSQIPNNAIREKNNQLTK